jgi:ABC-type uncharacterized transport system auxiliary subunit
MKATGKIMLCATFGLMLTACVSILPEPEPASVVYRLESSDVALPAAPDADVIRIDRPTAPLALSGQNIIVSPDATRLAVAAQARWSEDIPILIQQSMLEELGRHPSLTGVGPLSGARAEQRLHITVRNFEARFDNGEASPPLAIVHYTVTLSNASTRKCVKLPERNPSTCLLLCRHNQRLIGKL